MGRLVVRTLSHPRGMRLVATHRLKRAVTQRFMFKLWSNLTDPQSPDALDRVTTALQRAVPATGPRPDPGRDSQATAAPSLAPYALGHGAKSFELGWRHRQDRGVPMTSSRRGGLSV